MLALTGSRRIALVGISLAMGSVIFAGCSSSSETATTEPQGSSASTNASEGSKDSQTSSSPPYDELMPIDPADAIGKTIRDTEDFDLACAAEFATSDSGEVGQSSKPELFKGGKALVSCSGGSLLMDLFTGEVNWSRTDPGDSDVRETIVVGPVHVFVLSTTTHPAVDLDAEYVTRQVEAFDVNTGEDAWAKPLEEFIDKSRRRGSSELSAVESVDPAGEDLVIVHADAFSAFDAAAGEPLWHKNQLIGDYQGFGISLQADTTSAWAAYDAETGKSLWKKAVPDIDETNTILAGETVWQLGRRGLIAVDLKSGRLALNRLYPETWQAHVVTPTVALAVNGKNLQMFNTPDLRKPLWSTPTDGGTPLAVTSELSVVEAPSGDILPIDGHSGEIRYDITLPDQVSKSAWTVVDGLTLLGDGSVFELSPPTGS